MTGPRPAAGISATTASPVTIAICVLALLTGGIAPAADLPARQYPPSRAAELKALLLDRPQAPEAAEWAVQYVIQPEVNRLEPVAQAAERIWAARTGLAAGARGNDQKRLRQVLQSLESCPLDSLALRRC